jgi:hypothetical protein
MGGGRGDIRCEEGWEEGGGIFGVRRDGEGEGGKGKGGYEGKGGEGERDNSIIIPSSPSCVGLSFFLC